MYFQSEARCPYCHQLLPKIPQRKTKCPHCGQFYYVRTRPSDREKVIVTTQEADAIEIEWKVESEVQRILGNPTEWKERLRSLSKDANPWERPYCEAMLARSNKEYDKAWGFYNEARLQAGQQGQMGVYRNTTLEMANQLRAEGKFLKALVMLCEVCFYDLNGPCNPGIYIDGSQTFARTWNPENSFLPPVIVEKIREYIKTLNLGSEEFQQLISEHLEKISSALQPPFSPKAVLPTFFQIAFTEKDLNQIELPTKKNRYSTGG